MSVAIKTDPSMPENMMFMLPPDVQTAIETCENIERAYHYSLVSWELLTATVRVAEGVIRLAAKQRRIGVIRNIKL